MKIIERRFAIVFVLAMCILVVGCSKKKDDETEAVEQQVDTKKQLLESFVESFNATSDDKLVYKEDFIPSNKSSDHYRTEFRLNAFADGIGRSYSFDVATVDIIACKPEIGDAFLRIYMIGAPLDLSEKMVRYASPVLDHDVEEEDIKKTIQDMEERQELNGYYYSNLKLLYLRNEFMLEKYP